VGETRIVTEYRILTTTELVVDELRLCLCSIAVLECGKSKEKGVGMSVGRVWREWGVERVVREWGEWGESGERVERVWRVGRVGREWGESG
jgi:hypothetical protein